MSLQTVNGHNDNKIQVPDADTKYNNIGEALLYEIWQTLANADFNPDLSNYAQLNKVGSSGITDGNIFSQQQGAPMFSARALINAANPRYKFELTDDALHTLQGEFGFNDPASLFSRYAYVIVGDAFTNAEHDNDARGMHFAVRTGFGGGNVTSFWRNGNVGIGFAYNNGFDGGLDGTTNYRVTHKLAVRGKLAVTDVPEFADNAAAVAGGMKLWTVYRVTGTGNLQIVIP